MTDHKFVNSTVPPMIFLTYILLLLMGGKLMVVTVFLNLWSVDPWGSMKA